MEVTTMQQSQARGPEWAFTSSPKRKLGEDPYMNPAHSATRLRMSLPTRPIPDGNININAGSSPQIVTNSAFTHVLPQLAQPSAERIENDCDVDMTDRVVNSNVARSKEHVSESAASGIQLSSQGAQSNLINAKSNSSGIAIRVTSASEDKHTSSSPKKLTRYGQRQNPPSAALSARTHQTATASPSPRGSSTESLLADVSREPGFPNGQSLARALASAAHSHSSASGSPLETPTPSPTPSPRSTPSPPPTTRFLSRRPKSPPLFASRLGRNLAPGVAATGVRSAGSHDPSASDHRRRPLSRAGLSDLVWTAAEITGHLALSGEGQDNEDDGYGLNGIGFRPTPAVAALRAKKRRQQLREYKLREAREARQHRADRRQRGPPSLVPSSSASLSTSPSPSPSPWRRKTSARINLSEQSADAVSGPVSPDASTSTDLRSSRGLKQVDTRENDVAELDMASMTPPPASARRVRFLED